MKFPRTTKTGFNNLINLLEISSQDRREVLELYNKELERDLESIEEEDEEDCEISDIEPLDSEKEDTEKEESEEDAPSPKQPPRINRRLPAYNRASLNSTRDLESARKHGLGNLDEDHNEDDDVEYEDLPLPAPGNGVLTAEQLQRLDREPLIKCSSSYKTPTKTPAKKRNKRKEPSPSEQESSDDEEIRIKRDRKKQKLHTGVNGIVETERQMFVRRVTIFRDINPPWSDEEKQAIRLLSHRVSQGISTPEVRQFLRDMGFNFGPASVQKIYQKIKTTWRSVKKTFKQGTGN